MKVFTGRDLAISFIPREKKKNNKKLDCTALTEARQV
jgi:hypothetical protein